MLHWGLFCRFWVAPSGIFKVIFYSALCRVKASSNISQFEHLFGFKITLFSAYLELNLNPNAKYAPEPGKTAFPAVHYLIQQENWPPRLMNMPAVKFSGLDK